MASLVEEIRVLQALPTPGRARAIREAAGISQERLSEELGIHRVTLTNWELGKRRPVGANRLRYAEMLEQIRKELVR